LNFTGSVAVRRLHLLTKHRVFSGPGFQVATELGEAANGGQVLLTEEAWARLRGNMSAAGFPVVEQLGLYKLAAWPVPMWIYQVRAGSTALRMQHRPCEH
jgi:class 3 adenylate cyclase